MALVLLALLLFDAIQNVLQLLSRTVNRNRGALGVLCDCVLDLLGVPDLGELRVLRVVSIFSLGDKDVDVRLCLRGVRVILEDGGIRVDAGAVQEGVIDNGRLTLTVGGRSLSCLLYTSPSPRD